MRTESGSSSTELPSPTEFQTVSLGANSDRQRELPTVTDADPPSGAGGGTAPAGGPPAPAGEAVSTTCLAHLTEPQSWQFLACGMDTLDCSLVIEWGDDWDQVSAKLEAAKQRAAGTKGVLSDDLRYIIRPSGKPPSYAWHLAWPEFHLYLGKSQCPTGHNTNGLVKLSSKLLWAYGAQVGMALVAQEIEKLGGKFLNAKPSRIDLAADFCIPRGMTLDLLLEQRVPCHL